MVETPEVWEPVPVKEFSEIYAVSNLGRVKRVASCRGCKADTILTPFVHKDAKGSKRNIIRLNLNYKRKEFVVARLVYAAFKNGGKELPVNVSIAHDNGILLDDSLNNLKPMTRHMVGKEYGGRSKRRPVIRIRRDGTEDACYTSARSAAKENFCSYQTVIDHCNGKVKNRFGIGFSFKWDD